ncbi:LuxR C-terminal-related transcriptional regulator [Nocardioides soli]|uniref:DNA-binding NarL/FixJ family response regulator n=1 Tax=Nocardioides soli TaxID=1036020 RepID=A0A7W4VYW8_9ACTN|nr:DNA-binding NarL/FixJ family response regulator [Nocardioides soli]
MPEPIQVAIVDDHELVSLAVGGLIHDHEALEFAGHAASVPQFIAAGIRARLVVLDLNLRDGSQPSENVERLRDRGTDVLVLTSGENPFLIREVSRSGVLGIVRKSAAPEDIIGAIAAAAAGQPIVTTEWAAALDSDPELGSAPLTDREREVLALYASGLPAKSVARRLSVTENTIDDHIRRIRTVYAQLSRPANTKVDLYRRGMEDGILPYPTLS